ncbi:MAG TPA: hypothetical protein VGG25_31145 [Streptosporangiaceae bacterium]|jgi:hypothetical protein
MPVDDAVVIRGRILARLLGIRLLALDTDITVGPREKLSRTAGPGSGRAVSGRPQPAARALGVPAGRGRAFRAAPGSGIARARRLVEQASDDVTPAGSRPGQQP